MAKAILIRCETLSNPYWIGLLRVEPNGSRLAWHSPGWPTVLPSTSYYLSPGPSSVCFAGFTSEETFWYAKLIEFQHPILSKWSWKLKIWYWTMFQFFIFCVPIICATNIFVLVIRCKGPYILSWINAGGYNVRQDDGVKAGEAWAHWHFCQKVISLAHIWVGTCGGRAGFVF